MLLEHLESRRLCSVTVRQGWPGDFEIYGTDGDDEITVDVNADAGTFSVDGQTFPGVLQLTVYGQAGNDQILVSANHGSYITASIDGGEGDDVLSLNFDGAIRGDEGSDRIYLYDSFRGEVLGGSGDDFIWLTGDNVDANIDGGEGDDWIDASANNYKVFIHGGDGNDVIFGSNFDDRLFGDGGNNAIYGNGGDDQIYIRNGTYDCADGGGDRGDTCYCDRTSEFEDGVSGFENVFYG